MYPIPANATRIRYVQANGIAYIDTGVPMASGYTMKVRFSFDGPTNENVSPGGFWYNNQKAQRIYWRGGSSDWRYQYPTQSAYVFATQPTFSGIHELEMGGTSILFDGATTTVPAQTSFSSSYSQHLFGSVSYNSATEGIAHELQSASSIIRVYSASWTDGNGVPVRDFVPIRVGQTPYMFDRVTGTLFGKQGEGTFTAGPDTFQQGVVPTRMMAMGVRKKRLYDAEVLWISPAQEQSGLSEAYIDAGFVPTSSTQIYAKFFITSVYPNYAWYVFGRQTHNSTSRCQISRSNSSTNPLDVGISGTYKDFAASDNTEYEISIDFASGSTTINGTTTAGFSVSSLGNYGVNIFTRQTSETNRRSDVVRLERLIFSEGGVAIRDFVPVRIGTVGYLYDKVSKQLFGNAGTGSFVLGPDK